MVHSQHKTNALAALENRCVCMIRETRFGAHSFGICRGDILAAPAPGNEPVDIFGCDWWFKVILVPLKHPNQGIHESTHHLYIGFTENGHTPKISQNGSFHGECNEKSLDLHSKPGGLLGTYHLLCPHKNVLQWLWVWGSGPRSPWLRYLYRLWGLNVGLTWFGAFYLIL